MEDLLSQLRNQTENVSDAVIVEDIKITGSEKSGEQVKEQSGEFSAETKEPKAKAPEEEEDDDDEEESEEALDPQSKKDYQKAAGRWVKKINIGLKMALKPAYKATMLKNGDEQKCKDFWEDNKNRTKRQVENEAGNDPDLYRAFLRYAAYKEEEKRIPLDKDESEELIDALADWMEETKKTKPSAGAMLALSVLAISLSRIEPMFPGLMEKIMGK